jgi:hypothetical protein
MSADLAEQICVAAEARLTRIQQLDGYQTDIGLNVVEDRELIDFTADPMPCASLEQNSEEAVFDEVAVEHTNKLAVSVYAHGEVTVDVRAGTLARRMLADVKRALLDADDPRLLGLLVSPVEYAGSVIELPGDGERCVSVRADFLLTYVEGYGDPYTQLTNN